MRRNPRERESYVVLTLDGREVGRLGPYQTMRGALADAKTMAISRRDNDAANDGIDAMVHTHKDALGQDVAYEVVEGRFATGDLPHVFIARAVTGSTAAARSGSGYTRKAQDAETLRFNPQITFTARGKPVSFFAKKKR